MTTTDIAEQIKVKKTALEALKAKNGNPETIKALENEISLLEGSGAEVKPRRRHSAFLDECSG
jgi:hypothetical protein